MSQTWALRHFTTNVLCFFFIRLAMVYESGKFFGGLWRLWWPSLDTRATSHQSVGGEFSLEQAEVVVFLFNNEKDKYIRCDKTLI
jgi:hypothetical protein